MNFFDKNKCTFLQNNKILWEVARVSWVCAPHSSIGNSAYLEAGRAIITCDFCLMSQDGNLVATFQ